MNAYVISTDTPSSNNDEILCMICLEQIKNTNEHPNLGCTCNYINVHKACLTQWIRLNHTCPICKERVREDYLSSNHVSSKQLTCLGMFLLVIVILIIIYFRQYVQMDNQQTENEYSNMGP